MAVIETNQKFTVFDARLSHPFGMYISGRSQSGKSHFVHKLIKNAHLYIDVKPVYLVWIYGQFTKELQNLKESYNESNLTLLDKIPTSLQEYIDEKQPGLFVFDDVIYECVNSSEVMKLMTKYVHHLNVSAIIISQELSPQGLYSKVIKKNCHYFILYKNLLDYSEVSSLAKKILPYRSPIFVKIFKAATDLSKHAYLFLDGKSLIPEATFRTDILNPLYQRVFIPIE